MWGGLPNAAPSAHHVTASQTLQDKPPPSPPPRRAGRYLEIFARKNNLRNYWVSIGNEVTGTGAAAGGRGARLMRGRQSPLAPCRHRPSPRQTCAPDLRARMRACMHAGLPEEDLQAIQKSSRIPGAVYGIGKR